MRRAEFEEREFETPLYKQLKVANNRIWSPGQVLEHYVGFDYAALCLDSYFWAIHGLREPYDGFLLDEMIRRRFWRHRNPGRPLPDFSLNLFLQAKRPEVRARLTKALKGQPLKAPYWRIGIDAEQQRTLESLASATAGKALVCYATPAFDRLSQLYAHTVGGTMVANSSFPEVQWLSAKDAWNYDRPGATGVANAEPVYLERPDLYARVETLAADNASQGNEAYGANLAKLAQAVVRAAESTAGASPARPALFFQRTAEIASLLEVLDVARYRDALRDFLTVLAFGATYQLQWFVIGSGPA